MQVTVIIPSYNRADMLPLALDSVLGQTYQDFEILVVDDGSTDRTPQVMEHYLSRSDGRLKYFHKPNGGCASARNLGLREARGRYVTFLDSDDWLLPRKLERQIAGLESAQADVAFGPWFDYYLDVQRYIGPLYPVAYDRPEDFARLHFLNTNFSFTCALVRRECFDLAHGPFNEQMRWNEDSDLAQRLAMAGRRWVPVDYASFVRRVHPGSKSQNRVRIYEHLLDSTQRVAEAYPEFRCTLGPAYDRRLVELHGLLARAQFRQGCVEARRSLERAVAAHPHLKTDLWAQTRSVRLAARLFGEGNSVWRQLAPHGVRRFWRERLKPVISRVASRRQRRRRQAAQPEVIPGAPPVF